MTDSLRFSKSFKDCYFFPIKNFWELNTLMHGSLVMIIHTYRDIVYVLEYIFQNFDYLWAQFYACKQIWLSSCFVTIVTGGGGGGVEGI